MAGDGRARAPRTGAAVTWVVLTGLLVVPLLGLGGWWAVARAENPTRSAADVDAVVVPVTHEDVRARATVSLTVGDVPGREVTGTVTGTVTAAPVAGSTYDTGDELLRVDDRPVRAMVSGAPLWRALGPGDVGADVRRLQEMLATLGYLTAAPDGRYGERTARAVAAFNRDGGRGPSVREMDPASVVWIGPEPLVVAEVLVAVGGVVGPGVPVVRGPARPDVVEVTEPPGGVDGAGAFGGAAHVVVGDVEVPYVPGSGAITSPEDAQAVRTALAPATEGTAQVVAAEASRVALVPASALVNGADGTVCVYAGLGAEPTVVTPLGGGVGSAQLPADLPLGEVLANPGRVVPDRPCAS